MSLNQRWKKWLKRCELNSHKARTAALPWASQTQARKQGGQPEGSRAPHGPSEPAQAIGAVFGAPLAVHPLMT